MARLIDADKIADYVCDKCGADNCDRNPTHCIERDFAMACAKEMPEAVVRCKDCRHKPTGSGINHDITFPEQDYRCPCRCEDYWYSWMPDDDWFCANGERREDDSK